MPIATRSVLTLAIASIALTAMALPATAQNVRSGQRSAPAAQPSANANPGSRNAASPKDLAGPKAVVPLAEAPFMLESAGLIMYLPADAQVQSTTAGSRASVQVIPKEGTWLMNIQTARANNPDTQASDLVDEVMLGHMRAAGEIFLQEPDGSQKLGTRGDGVGVKGRILVERGPIIINSREASRAYFLIASESNKPATVRGLTVFKSAANEFITFELITTEPQWQKVRPTYETVVATVSITDPAMLNASRGAAVQAGLKIFEKLTPADYEAVLTTQPERWERWYRPAPTNADSDATELGYRRIRTSIGTRADLTPNAKAGSVADRQPGYIFRMDARVLLKERAIDNSSIFFVSPDREEEAWNVRTAIRDAQRKVTAQSSEVGARSNKSMSVQIDMSGSPSKVVKPVLQGEGYISRVESYLMPQLLIRSGIATEYGFYAYQSADEKIMLRRDIVEQPSDRPGMWRVTTRLSEDKPPQVSIFNERGVHIRTELADGTVWEPISLQKLGELWRSKGLPME